ncbi:MAG: YegS/Rv2252/BmrU family lipid kinase [Oscillospiraceae bacterium]|nr:YegS/Rv2252/BmrU family lipid kinase [Oscillospiraceae bacterium]
MRHLFMLNPASGGYSEKLKSNVERTAEEYGIEYEIYLTTAPMDAAEKVKREAIKGVELRVYACGGDGTVSECAHGAAGYSNVAVTHFPTGTGNDFIKTFGDDFKLFRDLGELIEGESLPLDLIDVNGRKCLDIASVGIDARIGTDVHKYSKLPLIGGKTAYITSMVANIFKGINREFTFITEEGELKGKFALACVCNGQYYGNGFRPTRTAQPDDGSLEILIVNKVGLVKLAGVLGDYSKGNWEKHPDLIRHITGKKLTVESSEEFVINVDGEAMYSKKAVMKLVPRALNFVFPKNSAFLASRKSGLATA